MKHYVGNKVCDSSNQWLELFLKLSMLHSWCWALCCHGTSSLEAFFSLPLEVKISVPHVNTQVDIHLCNDLRLHLLYLQAGKSSTTGQSSTWTWPWTPSSTSTRRPSPSCAQWSTGLWFFLNFTILHFLCWVLCWRRSLQSWTAAYLLNGRKGANITTNIKADTTTVSQLTFNLMKRLSKFLNFMKHQLRNLSFLIFKISQTICI